MIVNVFTLARVDGAGSACVPLGSFDLLLRGAEAFGVWPVPAIPTGPCGYVIAGLGLLQ